MRVEIYEKVEWGADDELIKLTLERPYTAAQSIVLVKMPDRWGGHWLDERFLDRDGG